MPTNYGGLVYGPIFNLQSVAAHVAPRVGVPFDTVALDDTAGVEIEDAEVLLPVARVRYADLVLRSIAVADLDEGTIGLTDPVTLDVITWTITAARIEPTPSGRLQGMVRLLLQATA